MINHTMRGFLLPPADTGFHLELTSQKPQRVVICEKLWGAVFFRHYRVRRYIPCVKVVIMRRIPVLRHVVTLPLTSQVERKYLPVWLCVVSHHTHGLD